MRSAALRRSAQTGRRDRMLDLDREDHRERQVRGDPGQRRAASLGVSEQPGGRRPVSSRHGYPRIAPRTDYLTRNRRAAVGGAR
jgi:hypothetical protein